MNLWKSIVGFITHKKVLSSVIGIALVGTASAARVAANKGLRPYSTGSASSYSLPTGYTSHNSLYEAKLATELDSEASKEAQSSMSHNSSMVGTAAANSVVTNLSAASSGNLSAGSQLTAPSIVTDPSAPANTSSAGPSSNPVSIPSSTPSHAPSTPDSTASVPSMPSTPSIPFTPSSELNVSSKPSKPDNSIARAQAIAFESTRHTNALTAINAQYDPQISAAQTENQDVVNQNAVDQATQERRLMEQMANAGLLGSGQYQVLLKQIEAARENADQKVYDQRTADVAKLNAEKQSAIKNENSFHASQLESINAIYP